jgi:heme exporter protein B
MSWRKRVIAHFWWIIQKDLLGEIRTRRSWAAMLLLGVVVAFVFSIQMDLLPHQQQRLVGGLLWLTVFFAGMTAVERSFAAEREEGCWQGMKLLPLSPGTIYLAKLVVNTIALLALECLLIPLFFVLSDIPLLPYAGHMLLIAALASPALAAVGTLVSALVAASGRGGNMLVLVVLPLVIPVVLAAAECTRLVVLHQLDAAWWRWIQLLGAFALIFSVAGTLLFEYAIED